MWRNVCYRFFGIFDSTTDNEGSKQFKHCFEIGFAFRAYSNWWYINAEKSSISTIRFDLNMYIKIKIKNLTDGIRLPTIGKFNVI